MLPFCCFSVTITVMPRLWLINQFANTPDLPGHTRQFEVAAGLVTEGWKVEVFASDFNLTQRKYRRLRSS